MARRTSGPGRTLVAFFVSTAVLFGLVALAGSWTPQLGLDLQGGTSITLRAEGDPSEESLEEARKIIDDRVNGSGVAEAEVTTQGGQDIVVEVPGENRRDLLDTVQRTAQLRFRLVACSQVDGRCQSTTGLPDDIIPQAPSTNGSGGSDQQGEQGEQPGQSEQQQGNNRPTVGFGVKAGGEGEQPTDEPIEEPTQQGNGGNGNGNGGKGGDVYAQCVTAAADDPLTDDPLAWIDQPTSECVAAFSQYQCPADGPATPMTDDPDAPLVTCDEDGVAYLLSPAMIEGTELSDASAAIPQGEIGYVVQLSFDGGGTNTFADISRSLFGTEKQFAIVLDGEVLSAPTMKGVIVDGNAQISGDFNEETAGSLATSLKFGALPIAFEDDPLTQVVGPTLAGDQLSAGLLAGGIGLGVVMLYCLLYYRGLGTVVIASLVVAGAVTYGMVLLLSETAGFTLTLPGIAGLIVAVGITADSFIVLFERIRDEMRDGKSMRVAVESGWKRARNTAVAADAVSILAAVILYIFAAGVVKGFAFALGLTTIIDLVVFFFFTKPAVSWLARFPFFHSGHKLSGLNAETLGVDRAPAGGTA
ncbi:preprotein translocase subunit SecD [Nocardioides salarius]|uniref:Protein translocase subunit SecD n=1 Tax=Nocardioides salarius TaxID=374513 RepID=A0ABS2M5P5_9ACTN|nr:protein translocase subunit SecD [Nocardioides salarius]MBM7506509.1 preprotein translocase subunit SecD [Nocardioides salarius]